MDGALVMGEPHGMLRAQRPKGMSHVPTIIDTEYGAFQMMPGYDVLAQLEHIASHLSLDIVGFKECWVPIVEPITLVRNYGNRLTHVVVMIRDPRTNYASMQTKQDVIKGVTPAMFTDQYVQLANFALGGEAGLMIYERFIKDPFAETMQATGFEIAGEAQLKQYAGGGDPQAKVSDRVRDYNHREPFKHPDLEPAVKLYETIVQSAVKPS
jgi:hypothetical protein